MSGNSDSHVAIMGGARTPFVKAGKTFKELGPLRLACHAVSGPIERHSIDPDSIEALAYEMARRDIQCGMVSICAAGAMAGAFLLERS